MAKTVEHPRMLDYSDYDDLCAWRVRQAEVFDFDPPRTVKDPLLPIVHRGGGY